MYESADVLVYQITRFLFWCLLKTRRRGLVDDNDRNVHFLRYSISVFKWKVIAVLRTVILDCWRLFWKLNDNMGSLGIISKSQSDSCYSMQSRIKNYRDKFLKYYSKSIHLPNIINDSLSTRLKINSECKVRKRNLIGNKSVEKRTY